MEESGYGVESADGKTLYYFKYTGSLSLWRRSLLDGEESQLADGLWSTTPSVPVEDGVYFKRQPPPGKPVTVAFYRFATGEVETIFEHENTPFEGLSVSPDGRSILYSEIDDIQSDIMLLDDFQ